jgi:Glucose-6-phosphate dehydrogenase subunit N-terminal domain/Glucose-6-phosphate dehydrogenase subunit C-terminal domain
LSETFTGEWTGRDVTVDEIERELSALRSGADDHGPEQRTSVMTHVAWVPPPWEERARATFADLGKFYPSRTLLLLPRPDEPDALHARVSMQCFPSGSGHVCTELVELELHGVRADVPSSVVMPLLLPDLPVFLRWRGLPPFGDPTFERLAAIVDRLVVDSREWEGSLHAAYGSLSQHFGEQLAASDIVWDRTLPWRESIAKAWPGIAEANELEVDGPEPDALLLAGWLRSRLHRSVALRQEHDHEVTAVSIDGEPMADPKDPPPRPGELLSRELDRFGRDLVYEQAVLAAAGEYVHHAA